MRTAFVVTELGIAVVNAVFGFSGPVWQWSKRARRLVRIGILYVAVGGAYAVVYDRSALPGLALVASFLVGPTRGYLAQRREDRSPA